MKRLERLSRELTERREQNLWRSRLRVETPQGREIVVEGRRLLNFASNDYLGLANHPEVVRAWQRGAEQYGVGSGASALICGHMAPHEALEEALAEWVGVERTLLFSSGYHANLAVITTFVSRGEKVLQDRLNHASLLDGALLSQAKLRRYPHRDVETLADRFDEKTAMVATDAVFSMDGDLAPLPELFRLTASQGCWLLVDDAHGFGILGEGHGTLAHFGLAPGEQLIYMATLGKALGTFGAFVAACREVVEYLLQKARPYIYTTAPPPALAEATLAALRVIRQESWRREKLNHLISTFRHFARQIQLPLADSETPIQPLIIGSEAEVVSLGRALRERGFLVGVIRPPTVPKGKARLRISLTALHTEEDLARLLETLGELLR